MERLWYVLGSFFALTGVAAGAFAAHGLKGRLDEYAMSIFETAARYQVYHALALLAVGFAAYRWSGGMTTLAGWFFVGGIVVFSGSLYILSITGIRAMGAITPIGGVCFLLGWALLLVSALRGK